MGLSPVKGHRLMMGRCSSPQTGAEPAGMGLSRCSVPRASCQGNRGNKGSAGSTEVWGSNFFIPLLAAPAVPWGPPALVSCGDWDGAQPRGSGKDGNAGNVALHAVCSHQSRNLER